MATYKTKGGYEVPLMPTRAEHDAWTKEQNLKEGQRQKDRKIRFDAIENARKRNPGKPYSSYLA